MARPKYRLYKHAEIDGKWRYCRAASYPNHKINPTFVSVAGQEEKHDERSYCIRHKRAWLDTGTDPLEAQRMRSKLRGGHARRCKCERDAYSNFIAERVPSGRIR